MKNCGSSFNWRNEEDYNEALTAAIHQNGGSTDIPQRNLENTVHFFRNLTRKMHILSVIASEQVHRNRNFYKYLKLEQETERAHHILNLLEVRIECVKNKAMKYFLMLQAFKNIQKTDLSLLKTKHGFKKINKKHFYYKKNYL